MYYVSNKYLSMYLHSDIDFNLQKISSVRSIFSVHRWILMLLNLLHNAHTSRGKINSKIFSLSFSINFSLIATFSSENFLGKWNSVCSVHKQNYTEEEKF